jgi:hypothetical protein
VVLQSLLLAIESYQECELGLKFGWTLQHTTGRAFGKFRLEKETDYRQSHLCHETTVWLNRCGGGDREGSDQKEGPLSLRVRRHVKG